MAFSYTRFEIGSMGNKAFASGTYNAAGTTTGTIYTGLDRVNNILLSATGAAVVADAPTANYTPVASGVADGIPIIVTSGTTGTWFAFGS